MPAPKRRTGFAWRFWLSVFLGFITAGVVEVIARNPRYDMLIEMTGAALWPAKYVAHLIYPLGPHREPAWGTGVMSTTRLILCPLS